MRTDELNDLKERIAKQFDVTQLLDLLDLTMFDLVELLSDDINRNADLFESTLN